MIRASSVEVESDNESESMHVIDANANVDDNTCDVCGEMEIETNELIVCDFQYKNGNTCRSQIHHRCYEGKGVPVDLDAVEPFYCDNHRQKDYDINNNNKR